MLQQYYNCLQPIYNSITIILQLPKIINNDVTMVLQLPDTY
jgi:hypothetical protein